MTEFNDSPEEQERSRRLLHDKLLGGLPSEAAMESVTKQFDFALGALGRIASEAPPEAPEFVIPRSIAAARALLPFARAIIAEVDCDGTYKEEFALAWAILAEDERRKKEEAKEETAIVGVVTVGCKCGGSFDYGKNGEKGQFVFHSLPPCQDFIENEPIDYVRKVREWHEGQMEERRRLGRDDV